MTDETGLQLGSVEAGEQKSFVATGAQLSVDDDAARVTLTFKRAASALRLLGGGVKSELPAGYLRAEFLESTGQSWIEPGLTMDGSEKITARCAYTRAVGEGVLFCSPEVKTPMNEAYGVTVYGGAVYPGVFAFNNSGKQIYSAASAPAISEPINICYTATSVTIGNTELFFSAPTSGRTTAVRLFNRRTDAKFSSYIRIFNFAFEKNSLVKKFIPALNAAGMPCMVESGAKKEHANIGLTPFIAGFTLAQARKLGAHLPEGGGALTISLPTGYEQDAAVAESLETARVKGWTLTVQTYEAEAAAATFGMRRVWVRRVQDAQGAYVDADGVRWSVEWCADMVTPDGSTPDQHGYELYRSTEAAVAYWELTPWVDPEAEELLTTESL